MQVDEISERAEGRVAVLLCQGCEHIGQRRCACPDNLLNRKAELIVKEIEKQSPASRDGIGLVVVYIGCNEILPGLSRIEGQTSLSIGGETAVQPTSRDGKSIHDVLRIGNVRCLKKLD